MPHTHTPDWLIIGAGVVGLTTALEARRRHPASRVVVIEKEDAVGRHASGRNSGVLHAGIYYEPGSLKARFSRDGNARWTEYCLERDLPIRRCGKLVLATGEAEQAGLDELLRRGRANGVVLEEVDEAQARKLDPAARVDGRALWSPSTASVDPAAIMASLADDARAAGVELRTGEGFIGWSDGVARTTEAGYSPGYLVNAAGAYADIVARHFGFAAHHRIMPFKGRYLRATAETAVCRHLYPVPDLRYPFLGVHFTVGADGTVWIGPTASPVLGREQYGWRIRRLGEALGTARGLARLLAAPHNTGLRRLAWKEVRLRSRGAMVADAAELARGIPPAGAWRAGRPGIRAQLVDTREWKLEDDFVYEADSRSLHVLNAVSPGFTCALPLAEHLLDIMEGVREQ
ncbi:MAG: FAD-dependent oxidoreductase [Longimicrobiales bacterium]